MKCKKYIIVIYIFNKINEPSSCYLVSTSFGEHRLAAVKTRAT